MCLKIVSLLLYSCLYLSEEVSAVDLEPLKETTRFILLIVIKHCLEVI